MYIQKRVGVGCLWCTLVLLVTVWAAAATPSGAEYRFAGKWGSRGDTNQELNYPRGLGISDQQGGELIYVADRHNYRIQVFDRHRGRFTSRWGSGGDALGEFQEPWDIAISTTHQFSAVVDAANPRVQRFNLSDNSLWGVWYGDGTTRGMFSQPMGIAVDRRNGDIYVADSGKHRIQKFRRNGQPIDKWGSLGVDANKFNTPQGMAVDRSGSLYVADRGNHRIQQFNSDGAHSGMLGRNRGDGSSGRGPGEFSSPEGVAVDDRGSIYVADSNNDRIQKFDSNGNFIEQWGGQCWVLREGPNNCDGRFFYPTDIVIDSRGWVYVLDAGNHRLQAFRSSDGGNFIPPPIPLPIDMRLPDNPRRSDDPLPDDPSSDEQEGDGPGEAWSREIELRITHPRTSSSQAKKFRRSSFGRRIVRGIKGNASHSSGIQRIKMSLVRRRGGRCYRVELPSKTTSCKRLSGRGIKIRKRGKTTTFSYRPFSGKSKESRSLQKELGSGGLIAKGVYLLRARVYSRSGHSKTFSYRMVVR